MKKFYENPVVEITVFDVEDVITTSVTGVIVDTTTTDAVAEIQTAIEAAELQNTTVAVNRYSSYTW